MVARVLNTPLTLVSANRKQKIYMKNLMSVEKIAMKCASNARLKEEKGCGELATLLSLGLVTCTIIELWFKIFLMWNICFNFSTKKSESVTLFLPNLLMLQRVT